MRRLLLLAIAGCSSGAPAPSAPARVAVDAGVVALAPDAAGPACVRGLALNGLVGDAMRLCSEHGCWLFASDGTWTNVEPVVAYPTAEVAPGGRQVEVCTAARSCTKIRAQTTGVVAGASVDRAGKQVAILVDVGRKYEVELWDLATNNPVALMSGGELVGAEFVEDTLLTTAFQIDDDGINGHLMTWNGKNVSRVGDTLDDLGAWTAIGAGLGVFQLGEALVPIDLTTGTRAPAVEWRALLGDEPLDHVELAGADGKLAVVVYLAGPVTRAAVLILDGAAATPFAIPYCDA